MKITNLFNNMKRSINKRVLQIKYQEFKYIPMPFSKNLRCAMYMWDYDKTLLSGNTLHRNDVVIFHTDRFIDYPTYIIRSNGFNDAHCDTFKLLDCRSDKEIIIDHSISRDDWFLELKDLQFINHRRHVILDKISGSVYSLERIIEESNIPFKNSYYIRLKVIRECAGNITIPINRRDFKTAYKEPFSYQDKATGTFEIIFPTIVPTLYAVGYSVAGANPRNAVLYNIKNMNIDDIRAIVEEQDVQFDYKYKDYYDAEATIVSEDDFEDTNGFDDFE